MSHRFAHVFQKPKWLIFGFTLALAITGFFAFRFVASMIYWGDPAHLDQHIQGWMTPRYVARSWGVPPEIVADALDLEIRETSSKKYTMERIAAQKGVPLDVLEDGLVEAMTAHRAARDDR